MKKFVLVFTLVVCMPFFAHAEIASKAYVDNRDNRLIFGTTTPAAADVQALQTNGGVVGALNAKVGASDLETVAGSAVDVSQGNDGANAIVITDGSGNISLATGGYITNAKISSNAGIELGKLNLPTPGAECDVSGCMLMYYDGKFVWEAVTRKNNETIGTTGYVNAVATATTSTVTEADGVDWNSGN